MTPGGGEARARARRAATLLVFTAASLAAPAAHTHLIAAQQGTLNVVGESVFAVLSLPVAAFRGLDDDGDGQVHAAELARHEVDLREELDRRVTLRDGRTTGTTERLDLVLSPPHDAAPDVADQLVVLKHVRFAAPPTALHLSCDLFGQAAAHRSFTVTATRRPPTGVETDAATFTPDHHEHAFFVERPGAAQTSPAPLGPTPTPTAPPAKRPRWLRPVAFAGALVALVAALLTRPRRRDDATTRPDNR